MPFVSFSSFTFLFHSSFPRRRERNKAAKPMVTAAKGGGGRLGWMLFIGLLGLLGLLLAAMRVDGEYTKLVGGGGGDEFRSSGDGRRSLEHHQKMFHRLESLRTSLVASLPNPSTPAPAMPTPTRTSRRVFHATDYGADPTGQTDSTAAIMKAIDDAFQSLPGCNLMAGIPDLGGDILHLDGGTYLISEPLTFPAARGGNFKIVGGSLRASDNFPSDRYLIELWRTSNSNQKPSHVADFASMSSGSSYDYEYITMRDLLFDCNFRGGAVAVVNSLRTTINNCYITHFTTNGIWVKDGHETYISTSYLGQHITAGGDPGEKSFSGTAISLEGNDNAVTDVVIFSAAIGVLITGQANTLSGVHCYNKATGWGGTGIYLRVPGLTQTRIVNCYLDYTGIVSEDPVQLHVSSSFFLGGANIVLKSVGGRMSGVNIVDNMFSGDGKGIDIVRLDESNGAFTSVDQVVVHRNNVNGMRLRATVAKASVAGNGSVWTVDFSPVLLFPDRIEHVQYTLQTADKAFPNHALRNVSGNRVVIESDVPVSANVHVSVDQSARSSST